MVKNFKTSLLQIIITFFAGSTLACLIIIITYVTNYNLFFTATTYAPWVEEILKFVIILFLIRSIRIRPYMILFLSTGFGLMERVMQLDMYGEWMTLIPVFAHILFGIVMAYFLSLYYSAKDTNRSSIRSLWFSLALILPILLHLLYNNALMSLYNKFS